MRALLFDVFMILAIPPIFIAPRLGILIYCWISYMSPQQLLWDPGIIPWAKLVVAVTLLATVFDKERKQFPFNAVTIALICFFLWCTATAPGAVYPAHTWEYWGDFAKVVAMCLLSTVLMATRERLQAMIWIIVISLGFYTFKGGIFVLITAGNYHVLGPATSPFAETNGMGRACLMILPLMFFLALHSASRPVRWGLGVAVGLTLLALMGTGSRGAFVGLAAALAVLFLYSHHKGKMLIGGVALVALALAVLPAARLAGWTDRMSTIENYQEDASANQRFLSWRYARDMAAAHPIGGGGFGAFAGNLGLVSENPSLALDAHSNYFQVLGEQGYVGLGLYLILALSALLAQWKLYWKSRRHPELYWARDLAILLQVATVGYLVGGFTITHPYLELYYSLLALTVIAGVVAARTLAEITVATATPHFKASPAAASVRESMGSR